jgi:hypothetical protein
MYLTYFGGKNNLRGSQLKYVAVQFLSKFTSFEKKFIIQYCYKGGTDKPETVWCLLLKSFSLCPGSL